MPSCNVEHLMKPLDEVTVLRPTDTIRTFRKRIKEKADINAALVVENDDLVGIVALLDIAEAGDDNSIREWMTPNTSDRPLITVVPSTSRERAKTLMVNNKKHQLPVVDPNDATKPVGLVTLHAAIVGCTQLTQPRGIRKHS